MRNFSPQFVSEKTDYLRTVSEIFFKSLNFTQISEKSTHLWQRRGKSHQNITKRDLSDRKTFSKTHLFIIKYLSDITQ